VTRVDPTARVSELVSGPEAMLALDEAGLLIAAHAHDGLDVGAQLARFDDLAAQVGEPTLDGLRRLLFRDLGFTGNEVDYYDPRNSYLDDVLDRRTGIPISLAVLMLEVGRRIGVPLSGVSMPGHFLVRDKVDPDVFVDPFAQGALLDRRGAELRFRGVHGPDARFDDAFLAPVGRRAIVDRQLANLETIANARGETFTLLWVLRLRATMPDADDGVRRRLAATLGAAGRPDEAAALFDRVAAGAGDGAAARDAAQAARAMRARLN
jgi:regulator of sirC expression with transglutaminase-like and TPR domain